MNVHDLEADFPEHRVAIDRMRASNATFAGLAARYDDVSREVVRLEANAIPTDDLTFENLKKERAKLKDDIYSILQDQPR